MPPETEPQTTAPEGGNASPAADAVAQVTAPEVAPAPEAAPTTVTFDMSTEEGRKSFTDLALEITQPHFEAMKAAAEQRERSVKGQLGAMKEYQGMDEEGRQAVLDHQATKAHAIQVWVRDGVPKEALQLQPSLEAIDLAGQAIFDKFNPTQKPAANGQAPTDDLRAFVEARLMERLGSKTEPMAIGSGNFSSQVNKDNIDALHAEGKVSDEQYRTFLNTGQV